MPGGSRDAQFAGSVSSKRGKAAAVVDGEPISRSRPGRPCGLVDRARL